MHALAFKRHFLSGSGGTFQPHWAASGRHNLTSLCSYGNTHGIFCQRTQDICVNCLG